jgi:hypothetical protein
MNLSNPAMVPGFSWWKGTVDSVGKIFALRAPDANNTANIDFHLPLAAFISACASGAAGQSYLLRAVNASVEVCSRNCS